MAWRQVLCQPLALATYTEPSHEGAPVTKRGMVTVLPLAPTGCGRRWRPSRAWFGPFYIEGAEPGDTLVVHLLRLETNRATGYSASLLAPYTADPGFLRLEALREPRTLTWRIDKQNGVAY